MIAQSWTIMKLLVAETDKNLSDRIASHLSKAGFVADTAINGKIAVEMLQQVAYDAIIMDAGLPGISGMSILKSRSNGKNQHTPWIIISESSDLKALVSGLNAGADDYLINPFDLSELEARLFAVLRRPRSRVESRLCYNGICFDMKRHCLTIDNEIFTFSRKENLLLAEMLRYAPGLVTKAQLENRLYSFNENVSPNAIEALVSRVRRKLSAAGTTCSIETARGLGYRLVRGNEGMDSKKRRP